MASKFNPVFGQGAAHTVANGNGYATVKSSPSPDDEQNLSLASQINGHNSHNGNDYNDMYYDDNNPIAVAPAHAKKVDRQPGGRPMTFKKMGPDDDYDEEDYIIKQMRDAGYRDEQVVETLINKGLTIYQPKSVNTRYNVMKRREADKENQRLDDELTDWHEGDDDLLNDAIQNHIHKYTAEIEKAKDRFYQSVSDLLHAQQGRFGKKIAFSKAACRERHEALENGTAVPELELDPNPEVRQVQRENRADEIQKTKERKQQERLQRVADKEAKDAALNAKVATETNRRKRREEIARLKKEKNLTPKAQANAMTDLFRATQAMKKDPDHDDDKQGKIRIIMEAILKKDMDRRRAAEEDDEAQHRAEIKAKDAAEKAEQIRETNQKEKKLHSRLDMATHSLEDLVTHDVLTMFGMEGFEALAGAVGAHDNEQPKDGQQPQTLEICENTDSEDEVYDKPKAKVNTLSSIAEHQSHSWFPERNPRGKMSIKALRRLSELRDIPPVGDKTQLVYCLARKDDETTIQSLQKMLKARGVSILGHKSDLMNRLALDDAGNLVSGSNFYSTMVNPKAKNFRTFGSLTPDGGESSSIYRNGHRISTIVVESGAESLSEDEPHAMESEQESEAETEGAMEMVESSEGSSSV